jgi:hypothetical protein
MLSMGLHRLSFVVSAMLLGGVVGFQSWLRHLWGNLDVAGAFSFHVVVAVEKNRAPVLSRLMEGWPKLPSPLDAVRNSSVESSIVAHYGVDAPL